MGWFACDQFSRLTRIDRPVNSGAKRPEQVREVFPLGFLVVDKPGFILPHAGAAPTRQHKTVEYNRLIHRAENVVYPLFSPSVSFPGL